MLSRIFLDFSFSLVFPTTDKRAQQRDKGMAKRVIQSLSLNPLYQIEEDIKKISFNKSCGINALLLVFYA